MSVSLEVWGDYACFSRPEMKTERVSYDVITPSAARGILDAILWHPGMKWHIKRIQVCSPIRFTNIRRNEVSQTISARNVRAAMGKGPEALDGLYLTTSQCIQQRAAMILRTKPRQATTTRNSGKWLVNGLRRGSAIMLHISERGNFLCDGFKSARSVPHARTN